MFGCSNNCLNPQNHTRLRRVAAAPEHKWREGSPSKFQLYSLQYELDKKKNAIYFSSHGPNHPYQTTQDRLSAPADFSQIIFFIGRNSCQSNVSLTGRERHVVKGKTEKKKMPRKLKAGTALLSLQSFSLLQATVLKDNYGGRGVHSVSKLSHFC